jgi:diaminopimelate epimerase
MEIEHKILSGSGNVFTLIDNRKQNIFQQYFIDNIKSLCTYNNKLTDGLIIVNNSNQYDFDVIFFNPDGTTGMMCGNGGRCAIYFYVKSLKTHNEADIISFSMANNVYYGQASNNDISIYFNVPPNIIKKSLTIDGTQYRGFFIDVGSPHFIVEVDDISKINVKSIGKKIRNHEIFKPKGTNVNFFEKISLNKIYLRTFERGVEAETGACGTGTVTTAITFFLQYGCYGKLNVIPTSKSPMSVQLTQLDNDIKILLTGLVEEIDVIK